MAVERRIRCDCTPLAVIYIDRHHHVMPLFLPCCFGLSFLPLAPNHCELASLTLRSFVVIVVGVLPFDSTGRYRCAFLVLVLGG